MTFQEAQARFAAIAGGITPALSAADLTSLQAQLYALMIEVPTTPEFDPIIDAIKQVAPRLGGQITQATLDDLASRSAALAAATALLNQTAAKAQADARVLQFEQPRLIAAALNNSVQAARQVRDAVQAGDLATASAQAQALLVQLSQLTSTIKPA